MKTKIAILLSTLLLLLALACQQSDQEVDQLVDESIATALAALPTITPQPTATPQAGTVENITASLESLESIIESLSARLAAAESELLAQDEVFRDLVSRLDVPEAEAILTGPLFGSIVTAAIESTTPAGRCWQYRLAAAGTGNTLLVEWEVLGNLESLCFNPISICAREVEIGAPLPQSCVG